jgi:hypothetical protein
LQESPEKSGLSLFIYKSTFIWLPLPIKVVENTNAMLNATLKWVCRSISFCKKGFKMFRNTSKNTKILPKIEKYFQKYSNTSKNIKVLPKIEKYCHFADLDYYKTQLYFQLEQSTITF